MKTFTFWLGAGVYTTYKGETLGYAIDAFIGDGIYDLVSITKIEEVGGSTAERVTS